MPVIDGEKWACSSCIKGHRVSGCTHGDRELHHINPKGRPVKQCEHCRGARKSKSHHAKCDCGDKRDKHKDKGDAQGEPSPSAGAYDNPDLVLAHDGRCQCQSGAKCLCGTKDEAMDLTLDTSRQTLHDARTKPKLMTAQSEPHLTIFANGHHKPCHRNNNTAHVSGAPYKVPRPHTLHGHSAFAALNQGGHSYSKPEAPASRSVDTLSLSNNDYYAMFGSGQHSLDNLPVSSMTDSLDTSTFQDTLFAAQNPLFSQESSSPGSNEGDTFSSQQWPWTTTTVTPINGMFTFGSLSTSPSQDCLPNLDSDWALPSAGFDPIWSAGDLPLDPTKFTDSLTQPISHSGESKLSGPGLTAASSAHSETGEPNMFGDFDIKASQTAISESLFWEDSPVYRFNTAAPTDGNTPFSLPTTSGSTLQGFEAPLPKSLSAAPTSMPGDDSNNYAGTATTPMSNNIEDATSIDPWTIEQNNVPFGASSAFELPYGNDWF